MNTTLNQIAADMLENADSKLGASAQRWRTLTRMATMMADGGQLTNDYNTTGKLLLALDLADRLNLAVVNVIQNFCITAEGAYWKGSGMIGLVNASGIYDSRLRFEELGNPEDATFKVRAFAKCKDGGVAYGPWVDKTMSTLAAWNNPLDLAAPQIALSYRAANFFVRLNCPEVTQGIVGDIEAGQSSTPSIAAVAQTVSAHLPVAASAALADAVAVGQQTPVELFKVNAAVLPDAPLDKSPQAPQAPQAPLQGAPAAAVTKRPYVRKATSSPELVPPAQGDVVKTVTAPTGDVTGNAQPDMLTVLGLHPVEPTSATPAAPAQQLANPAPPAANAGAAASAGLDDEEFDKMLGSAILPDQIVGHVNSLASVNPEHRADCETLLSIRLVDLLRTLDKPTEEAAATLTAIYQACLKPGSTAITDLAQVDLANAYLATRQRLWG